MPNRYFQKFPNTFYSNTNCLDITRRPVMTDNITTTPILYQEYTIQSGARPDLMAENYYEDPYFDWLLYLNNGIIDPYYDWYMNDFEFNSFIVKKYGSVVKAQQRICYYTWDFAGNEDTIATSYYNNNLPNSLKKYYAPVYSNNDTVAYYKRNGDNTVVNTNRHISMTVDNMLNFAKQDIVYIYDSLKANVLGSGEIDYASNNTIIIKNVTGNVVANNTLTNDTTNFANVTTAQITFINIPDSEFVYWKPVTFYDYEFNRNEANRKIKILNSNYAITVSDNLSKLMKE